MPVESRVIDGDTFETSEGSRPTATAYCTVLPPSASDPPSVVTTSSVAWSLDSESPPTSSSVIPSVPSATPSAWLLLVNPFVQRGQ